MRSAVAIAALAAGALAAPLKRDNDVDVETAVVTDVVVATVYATATTTAGADVESTVVVVTAAETTTAAASPSHWGYNHWSYKWSDQDSSTVAPTTPSTTETPTSTYVAPTTPSTTETPTSTYVAPTTTETPTTTWAAATSETPTKATPSSTTAAAAAPTDYTSTVLYHHNIHRANHSASDLQWSDDLAASAKTLAATCYFAHNMDIDGGGYGQNLAVVSTGGSNPVAGAITDQWYNSEVNSFAAFYGEAQPGGDGSYGHFTQLVWKDTTDVGCATVTCPVLNTSDGPFGGGKPMDYSVCNYKGPGNYPNEFANNIGKPLNKATVTV